MNLQNLISPQKAKFFEDAFKPFIRFLATALLMLVAATAYSRDVYVSPNGSDDAGNGSVGSPWQTITFTLNTLDGSAEDPLLIHLAAGVYSQTATGERFPIMVESNVHFIGAGMEESVIDGEGPETGTMHLFVADSVENIAWMDMTLRRGGNQNADAPLDIYSGGGVYISNSNTLTFENIKITECTTSQRGGAIYCVESKNVKILNSLVTENSATARTNRDRTMAGGAYIWHVIHLEIIQTEFSGNRVELAGAGAAGALLVSGSDSVSIIGCRISNNSISPNVGGPHEDGMAEGVGIFSGGLNHALIYNNEFVGNFSDDCYTRGSAMWFGGGKNVLFTQNRFVDNYIASDYWAGSAIYLIPWYEDYAFCRNSFVQRINDQGATIEVYTSASFNQAGLDVISQNTIANNLTYGIRAIGWDGDLDVPRTIIGGAEGWGNNIYGNRNPQMYSSGYAGGIYRINATWNFWGEGINPIEDDSIIWPYPERDFFIQPFANNPIELGEKNCYVAFNQGEYNVKQVGDTALGCIIISNFSIDSSDYFSLDFTFALGNRFSLDSAHQILSFLETKKVNSFFTSDSNGDFTDTLIVSITDSGGENQVRRLPISAHCGPLSVPNEVVTHPASFKTFCYPNPFNQTTNIKYWLSFPQEVRLRVFDAEGRLVISVNLGQRPAGINTVPFDARALPSGIYPYEIDCSLSARSNPRGLMHLCR